jgi:hypothetical protein
MVGRTGALALLLLASACANAPVFRTEDRRSGPEPEWALRQSGFHRGFRGAVMIEGVAAAPITLDNAGAAAVSDAAACKEAERVLHQRLVTLLPAGADPANIELLDLGEATVFDHWENRPRKLMLSLCVINGDGVKRSIERSLGGLVRDYLVVQIDKGLLPPTASEVR